MMRIRARSAGLVLAATWLVLSGCHARPRPAACTTIEEELRRHPEFFPSAGPATPPNLVILLADALRPDHLGCYGYDRATSRFLDQVAGQGTRFTHAYTHATQTLPSIASLFTGTIPPIHGFREYGSKTVSGAIHSDRLAERNLTLAELLRQRGYATGAFVAHGRVGPSLHFDQGFDQFVNYPQASAEELFRPALKWMIQHRDRPFFCYLHFMDIHTPYHPPPPYNQLYPPLTGHLYQLNGKPPEGITAGDLAHTISQYDGQIAYLDEQLRQFWQNLKEAGLLQNTVLVLLADHGEELGDHGGFGHATSLYEELLHIPLIFWSPGLIPAGAVREELVLEADVFPTLAGLAGASVAGLPLAGANLFPLRGSRAPDKPRDLYAEIKAYDRPLTLTGLRTCQEALIVSGRGSVPEVREYYDLGRDPSEQHNLYRASDRRIRKLQAQLSELEKSGDSLPREGLNLDEEAIQKLRSLGYLK